jgi:hypothetical protein
MLPHRLRTTRLALALSLCAGACGSGYDARPAQWEYIAPVILQPNCATVSCHSRAAAVAGLDFSDPERGYVSLTRLRFEIVDHYETGDNCMPQNGTVVCQGGYRPLITPFDPAQSRLVHMLRERAPPRMPPDRPLFEADIKLIENWILLGAPEHADVIDERRVPPSATAPDAGGDATAATDAQAVTPDGGAPADGAQGDR